MADKEMLIAMLTQCTSNKPYSCVECPYAVFKRLKQPKDCILEFFKDCLEYLKHGEQEKEWSNTDIFVRDKPTGIIHKVGTDQHDSLWVDSNGTVHFHNLQNGDGCGANSILESVDESGYEFCPSDYGKIDRDYYEQHKNDYDEYIKRWEKKRNGEVH